jgi:hypothetical protein
MTPWASLARAADPSRATADRITRVRAHIGSARAAGGRSPDCCVALVAIQDPMNTQVADIGVIGLAVVGENPALNIESTGFSATLYKPHRPQGGRVPVRAGCRRAVRRRALGSGA